MSYAARVNDPHTCTMGIPFPHVGGVISGPGVTTVMIGHQPAATVGTTSPCAGGFPNAIVQGSTTVLVGYLPAARMGDKTAHGGTISGGCPTVTIGG